MFGNHIAHNKLQYFTIEFFVEKSTILKIHINYKFFQHYSVIITNYVFKNLAGSKQSSTLII